MLSQSEKINEIITELCSRVPDCTVAETITQTVESLRSCDALLVFQTHRTMYENQPAVYPMFYPVTKDGVFFTEDAREIFDQCKVPFEGSIIGSGSSETLSLRRTL